MAKKSALVEFMYKYFAPALAASNASAVEFMETLFCLRDRHIYTVVAKDAFELPGDYLVGGVHRASGYRKYIKVPKGTGLVVRWDENDSFVDIDFDLDVWRMELNEFKNLSHLLIGLPASLRTRH